MELDARTTQEQLTPEERRAMLRAFADRMLLKLAELKEPKDQPSIERAVRTAAAIERIYSRCDRAEKHAPCPHKIEAERARNAQDAIKARVHLAQTHHWGQERRKDLGAKWDAAQEHLNPAAAPKPEQKPAQKTVQTPASKPALKAFLATTSAAVPHTGVPAANLTQPPAYPVSALRSSGHLERFPKKWTHFLDKKERQNKELEQNFGSIRSKFALTGGP